jgi:hypothetical protein
MTVTTETAFDQAAATGTEAVEAARLVLRRAITCPWPDDAEAREAIQDAIWKVAEALVKHDRLSDGIIRPGDAISGLRAGPEALAEALDRIAADASRDAAVLADVIRKWEAAAKVRGEGGN